VDGASFNVPNFQGRFPIGLQGTTYPLAGVGGEATHLLTLAEAPYHDHTFSQTPHGHSDTGHSHADAGHTHSASASVSHNPHAHTYVYPLGNFAGAIGSNQYSPAGTHASDPTSLSVSVSIGTGNAAIQTGFAAISAQNANITFVGQGGGLAHNNLPPYLAIPFIIKT
jgi:microcystin-dependent protein